MAFELAGRPIGRQAPPYIVAELSGNHNQSLERAMKLVEAAAEAGADAVKLQTYTADTMTLDLRQGEFVIADPESPWAGKSLYELYQLASTPWEWHEPLFRRCHELGMAAFSTPFDETAVDFLETLKVPAHKIASFENTDLPLIEKAASTGKPLLISTGMASLAELERCVVTTRQAGCRDLVLLKCTSAYPSQPKDAHLRTIPHLAEMFHLEVGLSDHTFGTAVAAAAVTLGAVLVEKHLTLSRAEGGVDSSFSLEPHELAQLVRDCRQAWEALGQVTYRVTPVEQAMVQFRRSLYCVRDVKAGENLSRENVRAIRPGLGLPPGEIGRVLGRQARRDLVRGTPLAWDLIGD